MNQNNISSIAFRVYEPVVSPSSTYTFNASDVESALRSDGHLAYMDAVRRGIWCFYLFGKEAASGQAEQYTLGTTIDVCGYHLALVEEGAFEPVSLLKSRPPGTNPINTPSSSSSSGSALDASARSTLPFNAASANSMGDAGPVEVEGKIVPSIMPDPKGYGSVPVKEMHEFFINALLSSLSINFCRSTGAISLTSRTVLLPPDISRLRNMEVGGHVPASAMATFRVYLTTTGSLIINLSISLVEGLVSAAESLHSNLCPSGTPVLAAPLGAFASFQGFPDKDVHNSDNVAVQSPDTQVSRFRPDSTDRFSQWRSNLSKLLQMRGISPTVLDGCSWLNIQFLRRKPHEQRLDGKRSPLGNPPSIIAWPSVLCFRKPMAGLLSRHSAGKTLDTNGSKDFDPLNAAKAWNDKNLEREETFSKRRKEREVATAARSTAELDGRNQQPNGASPLMLRRASNAGAAPGAAGGAAGGTMYPTPPDAVQPPGVTPSFDGAVSSPANPPNATAITEVDTTMTTDQQLNAEFADGWDSNQKREQGAIFLEGENLFGDLGEDMFNNNELTDADFNFFDEEPGHMELDLSGLPDMDSAMDMSANAPQTTAEPSQSTMPTTGGGNQPFATPVSPEFTKPELKHARSTLNEDGRQQMNLESFNANASLRGIKRQPSPFSPDTVYKRIRASFQGPSPPKSVVAAAPTRRSSVFEKVDFDPSLSLANKKYQESGQFDYPLSSLKEEKKGVDYGDAPTAGRYQGRIKSQSLKELPSNIGALIAKLTGGLESSSLQQGSVKREDQLSDADDMSLISDQDDSSDTTDEPSSPAKSNVVRKRVDDDTLSLAASFNEFELSMAESPAYGSGELPRLSNPGTQEFAVTKYFADPEPWPLQLTCPDDEFITVAQILTEQAVSGTLVLGSKNPEADPRETRRGILNATRRSLQCLRSVLPTSLGNASHCQFRPFIEVQDVPLLGPPSRMQPRPAGQELVRPNLFQIPAPHVELRRYESTLSLLPSAVAFWESLGLGPSQGGKDINAICVFPDWVGMHDNAGSFLDRIRSVYESLKMGTFERMPSSNGVVDGCLAYVDDRDPASPRSPTPLAYSALSEGMLKLSQALSSLTVTDKNCVVYFVYIPENPSSIVESCSAFQELFARYKKAMADKHKPVGNELVLQLVPLDFLASESSVPILSPGEYTKLCLETYDRCTLFGGPMPAPAIVLEQALPRMIDFKLTTTPSANLLHENSCIHIAYAQSVDDRWVTAAWTDNRGSKQMTASYCLGRRGKQLSTPLAEIVHEIWETTHDLTSMWKVHWRVVVTKCGPMDQTEAEYWTTLAQTENKASVSLTLVTVDTNPSLQLIPPVVKIPPTAPSIMCTTPVSTPQPSSIVSPEQSGNTPTPMGATSSMSATTPGGDTGATEPDADTTLVDVTDTTWGAVVSHRLNNSPSLTDLNPALQSGYLVKRGGTSAEDPLVAMEVNIIHSEGNPHPRLYEGLLREMLSCFRGLGTLARLRGVVDRETDVRPWHIAAAEKGVRALYQLM